MHFVIVGCGRVGISLATSLDKMGHSVAVIDSNCDSLALLPPDFKGTKITGYGFDEKTLKLAKINDAFALAAVTDNDNTNILSTRLAREKFGLEKVVARVYNLERAQFFERLSIPTVATIGWTANQVLRQMIPIGSTDVFRDASGEIALIQVDYDESWIIHSVGEIERIIGAKVAYITRFGSSFIPKSIDVIQQNDLLFVLCSTNSSEKISHILGKRFELASDLLEEKN